MGEHQRPTSIDFDAALARLLELCGRMVHVSLLVYVDGDPTLAQHTSGILAGVRPCSDRKRGGPDEKLALVLADREGNEFALLILDRALYGGGGFIRRGLSIHLGATEVEVEAGRC